MIRKRAKTGITWWRVALLLALSIQMCGCAGILVGAAGGAGAVTWLKGELKEDIGKSLNDVYEATVEALMELELPTVEQKKDAMTAKIVSSLADGKDIKIHIKSLTDTSSKISIRIGTLGDKPMSRKILSTIHKHL